MACTQQNTHSGPLVIRYKVGDTGQRPMPGGEAWWVSPDVVISGGIDSGSVMQGQSCNVLVTVFNFGNQPINDVHAQAWVCDFTAGIGTYSARPSAGGAAGMPGSGFVGQIAANNSFTFTFGPWTPDANDIQTNFDPNTNSAHLCIAANTYSEGGEGLAIPPGDFGQLVAGNPPTFTPDFPCNSHHGQHNIAVVAASMRRGGHVRFNVRVGNPDVERVRPGRLELQTVPSRFALGIAERRALLANPLTANVVPTPSLFPAPGLIARAVTRSLVSTIRNARLTLVHPEVEPETVAIRLSRFQPLEMQLESAALGRGRSLATELQPRTSVPVVMDIALNPRAPVGTVQAFDATHRANDGEILGGVRVLAVLTP